MRTQPLCSLVRNPEAEDPAEPGHLTHTNCELITVCILRNFLFDKNTSIRGKTTSATASHSTTTAPTSGAFPGPVARSSTLEAFITAHGCSQIFKTLKMTTLNHLKLLLAFIPRLVYFWIIILKKKNIFFLTNILVRKTIT